MLTHTPKTQSVQYSLELSILWALEKPTLSSLRITCVFCSGEKYLQSRYFTLNYSTGTIPQDQTLHYAWPVREEHTARA